jgi:lysozyme
MALLYLSGSIAPALLMPSRRQKKMLSRLLFYAIMVIALSAGLLMYIKLRSRKPKFARYPEFGIMIPESYAIHGIDVSRYQQSIAWDEVKAMKVKNVQLGFAFIKATEGIGSQDPYFKRNWKKSKEAGMYRGAYHFFIASKDGKMQAENFINHVKLEAGDLPPVLDVEQLNGASSVQLKKEVKRWLETTAAYYTIKPIIYTNVEFYNQYLGIEFDDYPLWVAHYYQPEKPRIGRRWLFWQHSDAGRVNGIANPVDFNIFNGDSAAFYQLLLK